MFPIAQNSITYYTTVMDGLFNTLNIKTISRNLFALLDDDWMLVTAGNIESFNTMTASCGGFGILWNKPVAYIFIRPQRYTLEFVENENYFTLCFFDHIHKNILSYCGSKSGREVNKIADTGLRPVKTGNGSIYFEQASLVLECRKLYRDVIKPENFEYPETERSIYKNEDYHHVFIAEIVSCMKRS